MTTNLVNSTIIYQKLDKKYSDNIISQKQLIRKLEYINNIKLIIFDEFLFHKYSAEDYFKINSTNCDLLMYSTPNKIYNEKLFNYVTKYKSNFVDKDLIFDEFLKEFNSKFVEEFDELVYNFLTDFDTNIIIHPIEEFQHITPNRLTEIRNDIGEKSFKKEYLNKFLK